MNVYFKRGTQAQLDAIQSGSYVPGSFYLTEDTNRLYFAQSATNLADLNQYIHIWDRSTTSLPQNIDSSADFYDANLRVGDFYYWANNNILAIYTGSGTTNGWTQINPDTKLSPSTNAVSVATGDTNQVIVTTSVKDTKNTEAKGDFGIVGGANVHVRVVDGDIEISADNDTTNTTYTITTPTDTNNGILRLTPSGTDPVEQDITIHGAGGVTVTSDAQNGITITGSNPVSTVTNSFDEDGKFGTTLGISGGNPIESNEVTPTILYGYASNKQQTATFVQGATGDPTASIDVYTRAEIDDLIAQEKATMDAMSYKGMVDASNIINTLTTTPRSAGDTYKASGTISNVIVDGQTINAKPGDLIIASGNDNNIVWDVVPSGNDQLLHFDGNATNNSFTFKDGLNSDAQIARIAFLEDDDVDAAPINIETEAEGGTSNGNTTPNVSFMLKHGSAGTSNVKLGSVNGGTAYTAVATGTTQVLNTEIEIPTITGLSYDKHGHITGVTTATYRLKDTNTRLLTPTVVAGAENDGSEGTISISHSTVGSSQPVTATFGIASSTLKISAASDDTIGINLEWGTFN